MVFHSWVPSNHYLIPWNFRCSTVLGLGLTLTLQTGLPISVIDLWSTLDFFLDQSHPFQSILTHSHAPALLDQLHSVLHSLARLMWKWRYRNMQVITVHLYVKRLLRCSCNSALNSVFCVQSYFLMGGAHHLSETSPCPSNLQLFNSKPRSYTWRTNLLTWAHACLPLLGPMISLLNSWKHTFFSVPK